MKIDNFLLSTVHVSICFLQILGNSRLQSTMDTKNSSYFVLQLNKYVLTCDGNSFQMVLHTLSYAIAAWYAIHDVRCSLFKTRCIVNGTRSMIAHDTPSMIAHDTPFAFKTARCTVFKRKWCTLMGIIVDNPLQTRQGVWKNSKSLCEGALRI